MSWNRALVSCCVVLAVGCGVGPQAEAELVGSSEGALGSGPQQVVAGPGVVLQYADASVYVYTQGSRLYAYRPSARPASTARAQLVADVGAGVQVVSDGSGTVLIWYGIDPATGVGTLGRYFTFLDGGPRFDVLSKASLAPVAGGGRGPFAIHARAVLYTDHVSADGKTGDVVLAEDMFTLASLPAVNVDQNGACRPSLGFNGTLAVAMTCASGATSASLTTWDLRLVNPPPVSVATGLRQVSPGFSASFSDLSQGRFLVERADRSPALVGGGATVPVWPGATAYVSQMVSASAALVLANDPASGGPALFELSDVLGTPHATRLDQVVTIFSNHLPLGVWHYADRWTSPNGQYALYASASDPNTGLLDVKAVNLSSATPTTVPLSTRAACTSTPSLFTADSRYGVVACLDDASGTFVAFAGALATGALQAISGPGFTFSNTPLSDGRVVLGDHADPTFAFNDLELVDLRGGTPVTKLVAAHAGANFFTAGTSVIYSLPEDTAALKAGLYRQAL